MIITSVMKSVMQRARTSCIDSTHCVMRSIVEPHTAQKLNLHSNSVAKKNEILHAATITSSTDRNMLMGLFLPIEKILM